MEERHTPTSAQKKLLSFNPIRLSETEDQEEYMPEPEDNIKIMEMPDSIDNSQSKDSLEKEENEIQETEIRKNYEKVQPKLEMKRSASNRISKLDEKQAEIMFERKKAQLNAKFGHRFPSEIPTEHSEKNTPSLLPTGSTQTLSTLRPRAETQRINEIRTEKINLANPEKPMIRPCYTEQQIKFENDSTNLAQNPIKTEENEEIQNNQFFTNDSEETYLWNELQNIDLELEKRIKKIGNRRAESTAKISKNIENSNKIAKINSHEKNKNIAQKSNIILHKVTRSEVKDLQTEDLKNISLKRASTNQVESLNDSLNNNKTQEKSIKANIYERSQIWLSERHFL